MGGRYRIEREIGRGGMATVYLADDLRHPRRVAIKVLDPEVAAAIGSERFQREIETTAGIHHPHILPLFDSGNAGGLLYYVMPYAAGGSLRARLDREGQLEVAEALRLAGEAALALDHAHRQGVVHRDIKPENILLVDGQAVVADLGIARSLDHGEISRLTASGTFVATPQYASPEQLMGAARLDGRSDVYSLACVLYEMLAGHPPFVGPGVESLAHQHLAVQPPAVTGARPAVPGPVAEAIHRGLAKSVADRHRSAAAFAEALDAAESRSSRQSTITVARPGIGTRRHALVTALAIAVMATAIWLAWAWRRDRRLPDQALVAVFPFRVAGSDASLSYLGEGMVDLLAAKLTGEAGPRAIEPRTILAAMPRGTALSETEGLRIARGLGAAHAVFGSVVATPGQLTLVATMTSVKSGEVPHRFETEGPTDSLALLVDRLAAQLLAGATGRSDLEATDLTTRSLPALRAYLQGQAAFRLGAWEASYNAFERAIDLDSTFALAAIGAMRAGGWYFDGDDARNDRDARLAWTQRDRLARANRAMVMAQVGPRFPDVTPARELLAAREEAVRLAPDRPEAWDQLGEMLYHNGDRAGIPDPTPRAREAFRRAIAVDSTFTVPLDHLISIAVDLGDTTDLRRLAERYLATPAGAPKADCIRFLVAFNLHDDRALVELRGRMPRMSRESLGSIVGRRRGFALDDCERAAEILAHRRDGPNPWSDYSMWSWLAQDRGRPRKARDIIEAGRGLAPPEDPDLLHVMLALFSDGDEGAAEKSYRVVADAARRPPSDQDPPGRKDQLLYVAELWRMTHGDLRGVESTLARLRASPVPNDSLRPWAMRTMSRPTPDTRVLTIETLLAAIQRRPDAMAKARALEALLDAHGSFPSAALILVRAYERNGDPKQALKALRRFRSTIAGGLTASTLLHEEGRLASLTGDREGAIRAYRRYLELRSDPEPEVAPEVERIRQALARLTGPVP